MLRSRAAILLLLAAASLLPYLHTLQFGFIAYDDPSAIIDLPLIRSLSWSHLPRFFTPDVYAHLPEYMPLKNLSYALDYALFGLSAPGFRIQQQLWFTLSVWLTFAWLHLLLTAASEREQLGVSRGRVLPLAAASALLFAVHPVHVESVTWLSGRKDVLCGAWMAAALWAALKYSLAGPARWLALALAASALALLSKPTAVVLPALFALQEIWLAPRGLACGWQRLRARWPLHAGTSLLCAGFALLYRQFTTLHASATHPDDLYRGPLWLRLGEQLRANLGLTFAPDGLVPVYPATSLASDPASWAGVCAVLLLAAAPSLALWGVATRRLPGFAIAWFGLALLPSLATPVWGQYVAGRYLYHAVLGPILLCVWALFALSESFARARRAMGLAVAVVALLWSSLTAAYAANWSDSLTLFSYAASAHPEFPVFYDLAARDALLRGNLALGRTILQRCVEHNPRATRCKAPLGGLLLLSDPVHGERLLRESLAHDTTGVAHLRLAQHMAATGRADEALQFYERWLSGRGASTSEISSIAELALRAGQREKAARYVQQIVRAAVRAHPASPPPAAEVRRLVEGLAEPELLARVQRAEQRCTRSDCYAAELGW